MGSVNGPRSTSEAGRGWARARAWAVVRDQASVKEETQWRDRRPGTGEGAIVLIPFRLSFLPSFRPSVSWQRCSVLIPIKALLCPLFHCVSELGEREKKGSILTRSRGQPQRKVLFIYRMSDIGKFHLHSTQERVLRMEQVLEILAEGGSG